MIDFVLLAGRILLVVLLYIFLYSLMRTGVGLVKGQRKDGAIWSIVVERGPSGLKGMKVDVLGPVVIGRSPGADIVIPELYVSGKHARFSLQGPALVIEDLGSTNGTMINGHELVEPTILRDGDEIEVGDVVLKVKRR